MATPIVTPLPLYVDSVKIGEATGGSYEITANVNQVITDAGAAFQVGRSTCTASINTILPRAGLAKDLYAVCLGKRDLRIRIKLGDKFHDFVGKLTTASANWTVASGEASGAFNFVGAEPTVLG